MATLLLFAAQKYLLDKNFPSWGKRISQTDMAGQQLDCVGDIRRHGKAVAGAKAGWRAIQEGDNFSGRDIGDLLMGVLVGRVRLCCRPSVKIADDHHQVVDVGQVSAPFFARDSLSTSL